MPNGIKIAKYLSVFLDKSAKIIAKNAKILYYICIFHGTKEQLMSIWKKTIKSYNRRKILWI